MQTKDMSISDLFPSRYLKTSDVGDDDLVVTIADVTFEELGDHDEQKPVVSFEETQKLLVLNKTNANTIAQLYGNKLTGWSGKRVVLYTTEVSYQGTTMLGIRIRLRPPTQL